MLGVTVLYTLTVAGAALAAPADLDTSFGHTSKVVTGGTEFPDLGLVVARHLAE